jgi:uncharacterized Zn finger protein
MAILYFTHNNKGEQLMKCPSCSSKNGVEVDMHADGYANYLMECSACGSLWVAGVEETVMVKKAA